MASLWRIMIKKVLEEEALENPKQERARIKICEGCDSFNKTMRNCRICKCFIDVKAGMQSHRNPLRNMEIEITHCPKAKWDGDIVALVNYYNGLNGYPQIKE